MNTSTNLIFTVSIAAFLSLDLMAGLLARRRANRRAGNAGNGLPISAFSNLDHPSLLAHEDDVNPLTEAEIYVIYGRPDDARGVLATALNERRITADDVARFWQQHGTEQTH